MDTERKPAWPYAIAQEGGIGIVHKNLPAAAQAREVARVALMNPASSATR